MSKLFSFLMLNVLASVCCAVSADKANLKIDMGSCFIFLNDNFEFRSFDGTNSYYFDKEEFSSGFIEVSSPFDKEEFNNESFTLITDYSTNNLVIKGYRYQVGSNEPKQLMVVTSEHTAIKIYGKDEKYAINLAKRCK